jgi:starch-binding outer membrane protein, SusD/RagB family
MKTKLYSLFALLVINAAFMGCKKNLDTVSVNKLQEEIIYSDRSLVLATLANFYISVGFGQNNGAVGNYHLLDEANTQYGSPTTTDDEKLVSRNFNRTIDYPLVRRLNQFLEGVRSNAAKSAIPEAERVDMEGQAIFLRAWYYFCMTRSFGGMPIVGDKVFTYESGMDVVPFQIPRSTEADTYQYVIDQCDLAMTKLTGNASVGASVPNKWAALLLKARAAVYAGSISNYGNKLTPAIKTAGWEAGIPPEKAAGFYKIAFDAAKLLITSATPYKIQTDAANPGLGFYNAINVKTGNTEVIWALDRKSPNQVTQFTSQAMPYTHRDYSEGNNLGALLNLVESFENKDGSNPTIKTTNPDGSYVFYNDVEDPFKAKDARLWGTVIWPNATYRATPVVLQAGQLNKNGAGAWVIKTANPGTSDANGLVTSLNGPASISNNFVNKTGFLVRKFLDETAGAGLNPRYSEMWMPRLRIAEAYLIAAEAAFEMGDKASAVQYINVVRSRGGIQPLTESTLTFSNIVNEYRVEFAFEDHRFWDLRRWRIAHTLWTGTTNDPIAHPHSLYPYKVVAAGDPNNGKWVFTRQVSYKRQSTPLLFLPNAYYASIDNGWVNNNPKMVLNPLQ